MKTDPRIACANKREALGWALMHDFVAHPLMALTGYSKLSLWFHDYTSNHAWPRVQARPNEILAVNTRWGMLHICEVTPGIFRIDHPRVAHTLVVNADDLDAALEKAEVWFNVLNNEFGGNWRPIA